MLLIHGRVSQKAAEEAAVRRGDYSIAEDLECADGGSSHNSVSRSQLRI